MSIFKKFKNGLQGARPLIAFSAVEPVSYIVEHRFLFFDTRSELSSWFDSSNLKNYSCMHGSFTPEIERTACTKKGIFYMHASQFFLWLGPMLTL
jgi:hypothetical protein